MRSMGRVRGLADQIEIVAYGDLPLTLPLLRNGPLPLPQGERRQIGAACISRAFQANRPPGWTIRAAAG